MPYRGNLPMLYTVQIIHAKALWDSSPKGKTTLAAQNKK
jgi:hypothetical protein